MKASSEGYTLVEVAVAMLILALISTGVFSVVLTAESNTYRADRRQGAVIWAQRLNDVLQNYVGVDVDPTVAGYSYFCGVCGAQCNANGCPRLTGDSCGGNAFAAGCVHNANYLLPSWFKTDFGGRMCYVVNDTDSPSQPVGSLSLNNVRTIVTWDDPSSICPATP